MNWLLAVIDTSLIFLNYARRNTMKCLWSSVARHLFQWCFLNMVIDTSLNVRETTCKHLTCKSELLKSCEEPHLWLVKSRNFSLHPVHLFIHSDMGNLNTLCFSDLKWRELVTSVLLIRCDTNNRKQLPFWSCRLQGVEEDVNSYGILCCKCSSTLNELKDRAYKWVFKKSNGFLVYVRCK